ncbi:DUF1351 domain-containing protein [Clostridium saccharoperbutylacetonicum]|uniref:DUF1351 domain-containing protein n=1 Tax=Clostridium saccharoperbutylacetonicum TaxID=36745 RepID=UPI000983D98D|nr:DUF1351 domain-containing protein [Clostridium saccharoperbutylacetonicum]AQR95527.1 hypothetical protein CLSAP_28430 [Clostridium saccharoperbutylacetonicum]NSB31387.1 hypothetical protein [Clostridium saccharoperbutylacetonicum]
MEDLKVTKELPVIHTNFQDVKTSLSETIEKYKGIVVTEEGLQDCKATQKELAGMRNTIDDFRKTVKKDMEVPIKAFESQCKELIGLIEEAEQPIKEGILVFDNKRREEKRNKALELIEECIKEHGLSEKYATRLDVLDKYLNLSGSVKSVREDIEQRANSLFKEQEDEINSKEMQKATILATIESVNVNINLKLKIEDFQRYIDMDYPLDRIVREINIRSEAIRKAENPPEPQKTKEEDTKTPELVKEQIPIIEKSKPIQGTTEKETLYFYELKVIGNEECMLKLKELIQSEGFQYQTITRGIVNQQ